MEIKSLCRQAGIQQIDAGPKGCVISFRKSKFANPEGLVQWMQRSKGAAKMLPDHKLVYKAEWDLPEQRLKGVQKLATELTALTVKKNPLKP